MVNELDFGSLKQITYNEILVYLYQTYQNFLLRKLILYNEIKSQQIKIIYRLCNNNIEKQKWK